MLAVLLDADESQVLHLELLTTHAAYQGPPPRFLGLDSAMGPRARRLCHAAEAATSRATTPPPVAWAPPCRPTLVVSPAAARPRRRVRVRAVRGPRRGPEAARPVRGARPGRRGRSRRRRPARPAHRRSSRPSGSATGGSSPRRSSPGWSPSSTTRASSGICRFVKVLDAAGLAVFAVGGLAQGPGATRHTPARRDHRRHASPRSGAGSCATSSPARCPRCCGGSCTRCRPPRIRRSSSSPTTSASSRRSSSGGASRWSSASGWWRSCSTSTPRKPLRTETSRRTLA